GEAVLRNDFAGFAQQSKEVKALARFVHAGFSDVETMKQTFEAEWPKMEPILARIERELKTLIPPATTLVAGGLEWFDDDKKVKKLFRALAARDQRKASEPSAVNSV